MLNKVFCDKNLNETFESKGVVKLPLFSKEKIQLIREKFAALGLGTGLYPESKFHITFLDKNEDYKRKCHQLIGEVVAPEFDSLLNQFDYVQGNFFVKEPGSVPTGAHVHPDWIDSSRFTSVSVWIPLQDTNEENSTLEFVEGSHKLLRDNVYHWNAPYFFNDYLDAVTTEYSKSYPLKVGECVIFDDRAIHCARANQSKQTRISVHLRFLPKCSEFLFYHQGPDSQDNAFEVFECNSDFYLKTINNTENLQQRPSGLKYLRTVADKNRPVLKDEFIRTLEKNQHLK